MLASVGDRITSNPADILRLASSGIDWDKFLAEVEAKGLGALIYHNWSANKITDNIPKAVTGKLKEAYHELLYRNITAERFIGRILRQMADEADIVVLKGLALLNTIYDSPGVRLFGDVDLLIKKEDFLKIEEIIEGLGGKIVKRSSCETTYCFEFPENYRLKGDLLFDISWEITSSRRFAAATKWDLGKVWERSVPVTIGGVKLKTLSSEDTLVYLCYHLAFRHLFQVSEVRWYVDVHQLVSRRKIDWEDAVGQANSYGISTVVRTVLLLSRELLGTKIPERVFNQLKPRRPAKWIIRPMVSHPVNVTAAIRKDFWYLVAQSLLLDRPSQLIIVGMKSFRPGLRWLKRKRSSYL